MTNTTKIIVAIVIVAVLAIGVGYAAISNITLEITGTATASADQANFSVVLTDAITTEKTSVKLPEKATVTASKTDDTHAALTVTGLTAVGDTVKAIYTIQNTSADLSAALSAEITNSNTEYFNVSQKIENTTLAKNGVTTITVTVQMLKTPIGADVTSNIGVTITAAPVQPK